MDVNEKVLAALKSEGKPMRSGELVEQTGLDKKDVDKAIKNLKKDGVIDSPKRCYYALASEPTEE
ncbi:MAG: transcriptional regulator [Tissierellaceae bacterium]|nr:transcriptional regulator [Tissierellaceae bacterium]